MPTLHWIGKNAVVNHHRKLPYRLLHCDKTMSVGDPDSGNLLVQGDNLEALQALRPYYAGKVKCIYIDPPYNTGNEGWVYNDNVNSPEIRRWLGEVVGKEAEDLTRHDKWLCMMYPRLALLRDFLTEDGSIWISMDDSSFSILRVLMDEIFGRARFVATCVWQKRYSRENRGSIGDVHEYILVYAMSPDRFKAARNRVPLDAESAAVYRNPNSDPGGRWRAIPMTAQGHRPNQMYEIETPSGRKLRPPAGRCWSMLEPEYLSLRGKGRIWFGTRGNSAPGVIRYLHEVEGLVPWTWWPHEDVGHTDEAKKEVMKFAGEGSAFDTPKPERLMKRIIEISTNPNDLVLDSFAGSGTTASVAHKMGRRWITIESGDTASTLIPKRLTAVVSGSDPGGATTATSWLGGGGYRFCKVGEPLFEVDGRIAAPVRFADLAAHLYFAETGTPLPTRVNGKTPLLGVYQGRAFYLLYNGVLGDKRPAGGNVLTHAVAEELPLHPEGAGPRIVYGEACRLGDKALANYGITFRQIPFDLKGG
jgi:adenine-specific DNA-methyltransferase